MAIYTWCLFIHHIIILCDDFHQISHKEKKTFAITVMIVTIDLIKKKHLPSQV